MARFFGLVSLALLTGMGLRAEALEDILARMDQSARSFRTFSAKIKRIEFTKVLPNDKDETDGVRRLKRIKGETIGIVEFFGKNPETIRFAGKTVETYYPNAKRVDVYDASKFGKLGKQADQLLLLGIGVTSADLRRDFDIKAAGTEAIGGKRTTRLELIPRDKDLKKQADKIELWIPEGESIPVQSRVTLTSGNYDQLNYSDVQMNPALPDSAFELNTPPDVKFAKVK